MASCRPVPDTSLPSIEEIEALAAKAPGAGFVVAPAGDIMTMPGPGRVRAAERMKATKQGRFGRIVLASTRTTTWSHAWNS